MTVQRISQSPLVKVPTQAGVVYDTQRGVSQFIAENTDVIRYDTMFIDNAAISEDSSTRLFRDLTNKEKLDANFPEANKLCANGEVITIERIGVYVCLAAGNTVARPDDIKKVLESGYLEVKFDKKMVDEGPLWRFQPGFGMIGQTTENLAGVITNGVPSDGAYRLRQPQTVTNATSIEVFVKFPNRNWATSLTTEMPTITNELLLKVLFAGVLKEPAMR